MLSSNQSLSGFCAALPPGLGIRERRTGRQRGFIPLCRPVFLFPGGVQNRAICGTIEVELYRLKGAYGCSCLNWSARGCSGRWRGRTGHFMQSCCSCCGRSAATRQITASCGPRPYPGPRITSPRWQSLWHWTPTTRAMRPSSPPATPTRWRWAFCCGCGAPAGWPNSPAATKKSLRWPLCRR